MAFLEENNIQPVSL